MEKCIKERRKNLVIYPGTFDPLTNGHVSLVRRAGKVFDKIIVAVAAETGKNTLFNLDERVEMAKTAFSNYHNIIVEAFSGLLVDYVANRGVGVIIRGLRAVSDFEYEFQLALMNRKLNKDIQTIFFITDYKWLYISSTIVKAAAQLGGDVKDLVPHNVFVSLQNKYTAV